MGARWVPGQNCWCPRLLPPILHLRDPGKTYRFRTGIKDNTLDPVWNHQFEVSGYFTGIELPVLELAFAVYDANFEKNLLDDDLLGGVTLTSAQFYPAGFAGEVPLTDAGKGISAYLELKIEFL